MFANAYEWISENEQLPVFVTSDSILDAYHLIFDELLVQLEQGKLMDDAVTFSRQMMEIFDDLRDDLPADKVYLAEENVVFFAAALRMLDPVAAIPDYALEDVEAIVALADAAEGFMVPPGFTHAEDFTQYKPRGHYTRSEDLGRYFKAMMWYGRLTFRAESPENTQRAVMIALELANDALASYNHVRITSVIDYMVGPSDDLTPWEFAEAALEVFGDMPDDYSPIFDEDNLDAFLEAVAKLRKPRILSDVVTDREVENSKDGDWESVVQGMRVFGQRYVLDSYIFQNCVELAVKNRTMPTVLDVMAGLGSKEAWDREDFDPRYIGFEENLAHLRDEFDGMDEDEWRATLYTSWLEALRCLDDDTSGAGYPTFMRGETWSAKQLNTQAASWTQLTHDTILYRKQSYTMRATCVVPMPVPSNFTYVEPVPELFEQLESMAQATDELLAGLYLGSPLIDRILDDFINALGALRRVAQAELDGVAPEATDMQAARYAYKITTMEVNGEKLQSKTVVVSDVHTDPNTMSCLEEGVGFIKFIVVVVPSKLGPVACVGPVFQHYEFTQPLADGRLTDEEWKTMLEDGTAPEHAEWARDFLL